MPFLLPEENCEIPYLTVHNALQRCIPSYADQIMASKEYGTTWWGKKWLEALIDIDVDNRIPRGKSYANTGKVYMVNIPEKDHEISARVEGHYDPFY